MVSGGKLKSVVWVDLRGWNRELRCVVVMLVANSHKDVGCQFKLRLIDKSCDKIDFSSVFF